jgi:hypothetical protein
MLLPLLAAAADTGQNASAACQPCKLLMHFHFAKAAGTQIRHVFARPGSMIPLEVGGRQFKQFSLEWHMRWWGEIRALRRQFPLVYAEAHQGEPFLWALEEVAIIRQNLRRQQDHHCKVVTFALIREPAAQMESLFRYFYAGRTTMVSASSFFSTNPDLIATEYRLAKRATRELKTSCVVDECAPVCRQMHEEFNSSVLARLDFVAPMTAFDQLLLYLSSLTCQRLGCTAYVNNPCCPPRQRPRLQPPPLAAPPNQCAGVFNRPSLAFSERKGISIWQAINGGRGLAEAVVPNRGLAEAVITERGPAEAVLPEGGASSALPVGLRADQKRKRWGKGHGPGGKGHGPGGKGLGVRNSLSAVLTPEQRALNAREQERKLEIYKRRREELDKLKRFTHCSKPVFEFWERRWANTFGGPDAPRSTLLRRHCDLDVRCGPTDQAAAMRPYAADPRVVGHAQGQVG